MRRRGYVRRDVASKYSLGDTVRLFTPGGGAIHKGFVTAKVWSKGSLTDVMLIIPVIYRVRPPIRNKSFRVVEQIPDDADLIAGERFKDQSTTDNRK